LNGLMIASIFFIVARLPWLFSREWVDHEALGWTTWPRVGSMGHSGEIQHVIKN
jgi:hypothetical protein